MWVIGKFIFLCTLIPSQIDGQFVASLLEPNAYLTAVVDALWVKIKEHGISNLPVVDTSTLYNATNYGVEIIGPVSFADGFVQDIESVSLSHLGFISSMWPTYARIAGRVIFTNLRIYRDFRADLSTGKRIGTVVLTPANFQYDVVVQKGHTNDTVVPTISFLSSTNLAWDIDPDDLVTRMIRRLHASQIGAATEQDLVLSTAVAWQPKFTELLNEIVKTLEFPPLTF